VAIVNGRLSARSARRYARLGRLWSVPVSMLDVVCARTGVEAKRFATIGVSRDRIVTTGNLKADAEALKPPPHLGAALGEALELDPDRPLIVAGCTMDHEEEKVLLAFRRVRERHPRASLLIAPRHPERFDEVDALVRNAGFACRRRTAPPNGPTDVLVLDTIGELPAAYGLGDVAFVGGSLVATGGHNLLEPAIQSRPVLFGPSTDNFALLADRMVEAGGGIRVADAEALAREVCRLLEDDDLRDRTGRSAYAVARHDAAAGKRTARVLVHKLSRSLS
jgi:3-deoxy-D-manno-octulosonic-acid transferase